jgi:serine/threonine protein kinase
MYTENKAKASKKQLLDDPNVIKDIFTQMIQALKFLHSNLIYVWDIKSDNILITASGTIKIMDFGLGKNLTKKRVDSKSGKIKNSFTYERLNKHTAPELNPRSGCGIHTGDSIKPGPPDIFNAGQVLLSMVGMKDYLPYMIRKKKWDRPAFESGKKGKIDSFTKLFHQAPELKNRFETDKYSDGPALLDLLTRMLNFDPEKRPTPDEILKHEWCATPVTPLPPPSSSNERCKILDAARRSARREKKSLK